MSKYEVAFPVAVPVQAAMDLAKLVASGDSGGGKIALPAWIVGGFALRSLLGDGEGLVVVRARAMEQAAGAMTPEEREQIEAAYVQLIGPLPAAAQAMQAGTVGSWLSVWVRMVLIPLAKKAFEMLLAALNEKAT